MLEINKKEVVNLIIRVNNQILDYQFSLRQLEKLRKLNRQFGVGTNDIKIKEEDIKRRMNSLKKTISIRMTYLLQQEEKLVFCEVFEKSDNQYQIPRDTITVSPIDHFSCKDLNKGFITLTSVKKVKNSLKIQDWVFDIRKGDLIPIEEIDTLINRRFLLAISK